MCTAALVAEYAYTSITGTRMPSIDPMLITRAGSSALAAARSAGSSAVVSRKTALTLTAQSLSNAASG